MWVLASAEDIRLEVTTFLQSVTPDRTGVKQIGDVFANVKALAAVSVDGSPPLPFHLADPTRKMLAITNGLLDLTGLSDGDSVELLPHDPDWFSTSILPYRFDPAAKCPAFRKFLSQIFNADPKTLRPLVKGDKRVRLVQEMFGYSFLVDNRFQKFFILLGDGWNGKGTLLHVLQHLIGGENIASVTLEGMSREFGQESLLGAMLNLCGDMNESDNASEGTLKAWTGEDPVTVHRKYRSPVQIVPGVKFVFGTNQLPWIKDKSNGIWRRAVVVPFTYAIKSEAEADPHLRPRLRGELAGVLNWALQGLVRLLEQEQFTACEMCTAAANEHREACSPVREFIANNFTVAADYDGRRVGKRWFTSPTEIMLLARDHAVKFGDRSVSGHIVCRELAKLPGVFCRRPKTVQGRKELGKVYFGVCVGDPKGILPEKVDELAEKTGLGAVDLQAARGLMVDGNKD